MYWIDLSFARLVGGSRFWGRSPEPGATVTTTPQGTYCHHDFRQVGVSPSLLAEVALPGSVLHKVTLCPRSVLCYWVGSHFVQPTLRATFYLLGDYVSKYSLFGILNGMFTHSLTFTSLLHLLHVPLHTRGYLFIIWVIIQYDFMLLLKWFQLWPWGVLLPDSCVPLATPSFWGGALPYFLELQGTPASSRVSPASALESDNSLGIPVPPVAGRIRHRDLGLSVPVAVGCAASSFSPLTEQGNI